MKRRTAFVVALALGAMPVLAADETDHYAAKEAADLSEALSNFSTYNTQMAEILSRPAMTQDSLEEIHQITYTLEVALAKMIAEVTALADLLEEVHLASERSQADKVVALSNAYLTTARQLVP